MYLVMIILLVDAIGFVMWALSGQSPADGFFVGRITRSIVQEVTR